MISSPSPTSAKAVPADGGRLWQAAEQLLIDINANPKFNEQ